MKDRLITYVLPVIVGCLAALCVLTMTGRSQGMTTTTVGDARPSPRNADLQRLYDESLADRLPGMGGKRIDSNELLRRDESRAKQVHEMYEKGQIKAGQDYYNAAVILQHGDSPEDFILAHDLSVLAVGMGVEKGKWLSAATEDRFLMSIGRPQRFATQYVERGDHKGQVLYQVDPEVTDYHRIMMNADTLSKAEERTQLLPKG